MQRSSGSQAPVLLRQTVPMAAGPQTPSSAAPARTLHARQSPGSLFPQAPSQQTPSEQWPLRHSVSKRHQVPTALGASEMARRRSRGLAAKVENATIVVPLPFDDAVSDSTEPTCVVDSAGPAESTTVPAGSTRAKWTMRSNGATQKMKA
ncbi:MAG TPA: hypothetical protein VGK17_17955 [Propionicimonas sp.]